MSVALPRRRVDLRSKALALDLALDSDLILAVALGMVSRFCVYGWCSRYNRDERAERTDWRKPMRRGNEAL